MGYPFMPKWASSHNTHLLKKKTAHIVLPSPNNSKPRNLNQLTPTFVCLLKSFKGGFFFIVFFCLSDSNDAIWL